MKILLIEDDLAIIKILNIALQNEGYQVQHTSSGNQGLKLAVTGAYDAIILDLTLPDNRGENICAKLRAIKITTPIIALTGIGDTETKVRMFDLGVDDYLTKPFEFPELFARLKSLLRKNKVPTDEVIRYADLQLDIKKQRVERDGNLIKLRDKEMKILEYMLLHAEQVLTREMILNYVWGPNIERFTNVVDVHLHHLRDKIDKPFPAKLFKTINNVGYKISKE